MADTQVHKEDADKFALHISTTIASSSTPASASSLVSPRLAPYIVVQHEMGDPSQSTSEESHPRTGSPDNATQSLLHDLTQHEYDEMSKIETEMRQQVEKSQSGKPGPTTTPVEDKITIDNYGMVRVQGQELIKLAETVVDPAQASDTTNKTVGSENDCEEEAQIIDVMIQKIEKGAGQGLEEDDELTIIEEHLDEPGNDEEDETVTDEDVGGDDDDDSVPSEGRGGGEGEHVVIYLNSASKSKRQIQVNKCERCNLLFGSRSLLYSHYSTVHLSARTTSCTTNSMSSGSTKGSKSSKCLQNMQSQYNSGDQDFVLDPAAMVVDVGPRQFQCRKCGREFKRSFDVIRHFDCVHNAPTAGGLRAFACHYCDKAFARKDNLQRHERTHDSNRTLFSCETCHKLFTRRCDTIRHFQVVHQKSTKTQSS